MADAQLVTKTIYTRSVIYPGASSANVTVNGSYDTSLYTLKNVRIYFRPNGSKSYLYAYYLGNDNQYHYLMGDTDPISTTANQPNSRYANVENNSCFNQGTISFYFRMKSVSDYSNRYDNISVVLELEPNVTLQESTAIIDVPDVGSKQTVVVSNDNIDLVYHDVTYTYVGGNQTVYTSGALRLDVGVTSVQWAVPISSIKNLYRSTTTNRVSGTVTVTTYNATTNDRIGEPNTFTSYLAIRENSGTIPVINSVSVTALIDNTSVSVDQNTLILSQQTPVTITVTTTPKYDANIAGVLIQTPDGSYTLTSSPYTVTFLPLTTDAYPFTVTVTDSRGFVATDTTGTFNVSSCTPARFTSFTAYRCVSTSNTTMNDEGKYIYVSVAATAAVGSTPSTFTYTASVTTSDGTPLSPEISNVPLTGGIGVLGNNNILTDQSYIVSVVATPNHTALAPVERRANIGVSVYTIYRMAGGEGVAFGTVANKLGVEINPDWPFYTHGQEIMELLVNTAHPVGSIIETFDSSFNPNTLWPWTHWNLLKDCLLYGAGTNALYSIGNIETLSQSTNTSVSYLAVNLWTRIQ